MIIYRQKHISHNLSYIRSRKSSSLPREKSFLTLQKYTLYLKVLDMLPELTFLNMLRHFQEGTHHSRT
eukprot:UN17692